MSWLDTLFNSNNYVVVQYAGVDVPVQQRMNFTGAGVVVTDDPTNGRTNVAIGGSSFAGGQVTFIANDVPANVPAAGFIRIKYQAAIGSILTAKNSVASDVNLIQYGAGDSWELGNTGQTLVISCYNASINCASSSWALQSYNATFYNYYTAWTTDLDCINMYNLANFDTTSQTQVDTNFAFSVQAGEVWEIEFEGTCQDSAIGGLKFAVHAPAGSTVEGWANGSTSAVSTRVYSRIVAIDTLGTTYHTVAATPAMTNIKAVIICAIAGTVSLRLATVTAATTARIFANSHFKAQKLRSVA